MMQMPLRTTHIIVSILLILAILVQAKGVGLGAAFGGGEVFQTKRGAERIIFILTIILATTFTLTSLALLFLT